MPHLAQVIQAMRAGGYYDRVMAAGPELARVQAFLRVCAGEQAPAPRLPLQYPGYPCFPGLTHRPWHDPAGFEAVRQLEAGFAIIRDEALRLHEAAHLDYSRAVRPDKSWLRPWTLRRRQPPAGTWSVYLLRHMGVDVEPVNGCCPGTDAIVRGLPRACLDHAWGDVLFSAINGRSHLHPHCSIDNLRVRVHLAVSIPPRCSLRVGTEWREWQEGRCLVFEESFEHEVWNRSRQRRIVLIVDLWHPDLTDTEVQALTAGFRKAEVRRIFLRERIGITDSPQKVLQAIEAALPQQDDEPLIRAYWDR